MTQTIVIEEAAKLQGHIKTLEIEYIIFQFRSEIKLCEFIGWLRLRDLNHIKLGQNLLVKIKKTQYESKIIRH